MINPMTTLNTIIEDEKKVVQRFGNHLACQLTPSNEAMRAVRWVREELDVILTTAMQRAYEAGQSEERAKIRESFNEWFKNSTEDIEDWADRELGTITKDNLK